MNDEFLIRFGGENHIRVETLTEFLDSYRLLLYRINKQLGHSENDLIVDVFPPEDGSFKIRISPKYQSQLLNTISGIVAGTLSGLLLAWILTNDKNISVDEIAKIVESIESKNKKEITQQVYNIYQEIEVRQTINQTFEIVSKDENIQSLDISQNNKEILNIPKSDFQKYIRPQTLVHEKVLETEKIDIDKISIVIKTVVFEGYAKWTFIWNGYPITASIKDDIFLKKMNNEAFKRGDVLQVRLKKKSIFNEELNTYIVDEKSYEILEVLNHISRNNNESYTLGLK